jgi:citronellol/citronellal dehydrogenase
MKASQVYRPELLRDQVVIVTGGGSGIGREIAFECGRLGARVAIGGRKPERLAETAADLRAEGIEVFEHTLDIREPEQCEAFTEGVTRQLGPPDVLVNNAGGQFPSPAIDVRPKGWRAVVETNLNGTWFMTQAVGRGLIERRRGRVVNIDANMWRGFPGMAHTGAARAGVLCCASWQDVPQEPLAGDLRALLAALRGLLGEGGWVAVMGAMDEELRDRLQMLVRTL